MWSPAKTHPLFYGSNPYLSSPPHRCELLEEYEERRYAVSCMLHVVCFERFYSSAKCEKKEERRTSQGPDPSGCSTPNAEQGILTNEKSKDSL